MKPKFKVLELHLKFQTFGTNSFEPYVTGPPYFATKKRKTRERPSVFRKPQCILMRAVPVLSEIPAVPTDSGGNCCPYPRYWECSQAAEQRSCRTPATRQLALVGEWLEPTCRLC